MSSNLPNAAPSSRSLRLWPGVAIVTVQWLVRFGLPVVAPDATMFAVIGGLAGFPALVIWWLFFSRAAWFDRVAAIVLMIAAWFDRVAAIVLMIAALAATYPFLDVSIATGAMGMIFPMLALPGLCLAFVLWAIVSRRWSIGFGTYAWKPAAKARARSSARACAVTAIAGVWRTGLSSARMRRRSA